MLFDWILRVLSLTLGVMNDFRSYYGELANAGDSITLDSFESHHLVKVNRARVGQQVRLFDGQGHEANAELQNASTRGATLLLRERLFLPEPARKVTVIQSVPKGKTMEQEIRRLTELGVSEIIPLRSAHSEFSIAEERSAGRMERWHSAAVEGAKQSGNPWLPRIHPVLSWAELVQQSPQWNGTRVIASLAPGSVSPHELFANEPTKALACGFAPVTLGPHVLRVETAALALVVLASRW